MENVNNEIIQTAEELSKNYEVAEVKGGSFGKTFIGICIAGAVVGITAKLIHRNKDKIGNWLVNKLAKAGYKYVEPSDQKDESDDDFDIDKWAESLDDDDDVVYDEEETE